MGGLGLGFATRCSPIETGVVCNSTMVPNEVFEAGISILDVTTAIIRCNPLIKKKKKKLLDTQIDERGQTALPSSHACQKSQVILS